ncbi:protein ULTRAPETALA 1-like protein [Corchorus olitorius]|uniref:Protein ULTRAPETALA 1-like protein n=1 Tax=Corchorus olitorius TaxID=93759 RepID=A0A1R3G0E7_9ROSI|nr:protein ULTRAPETALA 1-like protein [Corchorus olitorius]
MGAMVTGLIGTAELPRMLLFKLRLKESLQFIIAMGSSTKQFKHIFHRDEYEFISCSDCKIEGKFRLRIAGFTMML